MVEGPGDKQAAPETETPVRLTSFAHGGGCGCKIAPAVLNDILQRTSKSSFPIPPQLMVGVETCDDAAVWKLNDQQALVATTDFFMPIVDDPYDFGRIAATNAISDVYAMGGTPIMALAIVAMPVNKLSPDVIAKVLSGGEAVCAAAGIPIAGGHTIDSVEPIYGLVAMGLVHPDKVRRNADARAGDVLILGKPLGVGIMSAALKKQALGADDYSHLIANTTKLNTPGPKLSQLDGVHALTDVTGFGLLGHLMEICRASNVQGIVDWTLVPKLPKVEDMAAKGYITGASGRNWASYGHGVTLPQDIDPDQGGNPVPRALLCDPQTSGGLLVSCAPEAVDQVLRIFHEEGFASAAVVGRMEDGQAGIKVVCT